MATTPPPGDDDRDVHKFSTAQVDEIANRAAIEQAKGILMFVYGIDSAHAFELLRTRSRNTQIKLCLLAAHLIEDVVALAPHDRLDMPSTCTTLLLTLHKRVRREPDDS
jgi:hypothetical protein